MSNQRVVDLLEAIADALELRGESTFRINAYREAARNVENLPVAIEEIWEAGRLEEIPGVGPSIAEKIGDFLASGESHYLGEISRAFPHGLVELLRVPGLGPKKARLLHDALGIESLEDLIRAAQDRRIRTIRGMGPKTEENLLKEAERLQQREHRLLLGQAWPLADAIADNLRPFTRAVTPAGSIRRRRETIGDIDLLASSPEPMAVMEAFVHLPLVREVLAKGPTKTSILTEENLQVDLRVVSPEEYGSALQHFTGSKAHNIALRERAIRMGFKLNEYGLFRLDDNRRVAGWTEEEIYQALGLEWIPPELRENAGEIEAAEAHRLPDLVELGDIKGELHLHTDWSDGQCPLSEMAQAAIRLGYQYLAVTDHSHSLGIAHGLDEARVREQGVLIQRLNEELAPFRIFHGTELEIRSDGQLDYPPEVLAELDYVGVSVHQGMKQAKEKITERILTAFRGRVHALNHPTGRLIQERAPYEVDLEKVFAEAKARGIAMEINGNPHRLDLNDRNARLALGYGLMTVLNTDAHRTEELAYMRFAVATARRGWVEKKDVLNALDRDALWQRLRAQKAESGRLWVARLEEPLALQHEGRAQENEADPPEGVGRDGLPQDQEGE